MILDAGFLILLVLSFLLGKKRGFTLEFFGVFKYLLIIYMMKSTYGAVKVIFKLSEKDSRDQLKIYVIAFILLYISFSVLLKLSSKFLKTIKLKKGDEFLGGILGVVKTTFIIFIIYIIILIGSSHSKRLQDIRNESLAVKGITEYIYVYSEVFPDFIKNDVNNYRKKRREEKLKKNILNELSKTNVNEGIKNNENNR
ncbi:MAG: CvpA family protein [Leptotrichiaceae bacterium]|nr:CvpA family protein [Leptotrichiaceae bacterium]